jgi:hypothetical protein
VQAQLPVHFFCRFTRHFGVFIRGLWLDVGFGLLIAKIRLAVVFLARPCRVGQLATAKKLNAARRSQPEMARGSGRPPRDAESGQTCNATAVRDGTATLGPCSVSLTTRCTVNVTSHFCLLSSAPSLFLRFIFLPVDSDGTTCVHLSGPTASADRQIAQLVNKTSPSVCSRVQWRAWQQFDQVNLVVRVQCELLGG